LCPGQLSVPDDSGFHDAFRRGKGPRVMEGFSTELCLKLGQIYESSCEYGEICLCFLFPGLRGAVRKYLLSILPHVAFSEGGTVSALFTPGIFCGAYWKYAFSPL